MRINDSEHTEIEKEEEKEVNCSSDLDQCNEAQVDEGNKTKFGLIIMEPNVFHNEDFEALDRRVRRKRWLWLE